MNPNDYRMVTYTGKKFHLLDPKPDEIDIKDIAHHLSLICRYNGAIREHYSVAQHSVLVSQLVPEEYALEGLMHDAAEAYIGDLIRPFKRIPQIHDIIINIEYDIDRVIAEKFNLNFSYHGVKKFDTIALLTEKRDLLIPTDHKWDSVVHFDGFNGEELKPSPDYKIKFMHPAIAEIQFLDRFYKLTAKREALEKLKND